MRYFAIKLESGKHGDNDFHVILGTSASSGAKFLNVEVSGVPSSGDPTAFREARRQLLKVIGNQSLHSSFTRFSKPLKVKVTGSLYFDADHVAGQVGPAYAKPKTVWEIHPVTSIEKVS